ncbi:MAG: Flp pilus assembly protein CpaB [Planctomycetota bacterium]|nr:Flp pilus assembly protein CpaB [Planctomycetota bacterium]
MKSKPLMMMVVAGGCGLVAMLGYQDMMAGKAEGQEETVLVLVAAIDVTSGTKLDETNTKFMKYPKSKVPENAVTSYEQYEMRAPIRKLAVDDVVLTTMLGEKGHFGASNKIPQGMRVVTIPVTDSMSHSGQIQPGDFVDVILTFKHRHPDLGQITKSKVILDYIEVFSIDNNRDGGSEPKEKFAKNVSLLVTPRQMPIVPLAKSMGQLELSLRRQGDGEVVENETMDSTILSDAELLASLRDDPKEEKVNQDKDSMTAEDVRRALAEELKNQLATQNKQQPTVVVEPPKAEELWTMRIYEGDKVRIEQVPIDSKIESKDSKPKELSGTDNRALENPSSPLSWFSRAKDAWSKSRATITPTPTTTKAG